MSIAALDLIGKPLSDSGHWRFLNIVHIANILMRDSFATLLIVPRRYFCGSSYCFMSWCLNFCAVGALRMLTYFSYV